MLTALCAVVLAGVGAGVGAGAVSVEPVGAGPMAGPGAKQFGQPDRSSFEIVSETEIVIDGHTYGSWNEVAQSQYFQQNDTRCGTDRLMLDAVGMFEDIAGVPSDCSFSSTNPAAAYAPSVGKYRIPVVVHVIQRTNGTGALSDARVRSQIDILNEDFLALAGTNGSLGFDGQIEFYLADADPNGNPTSGITRSTNNTWFNDDGSYFNSLAWDTNRYLNIYTNSASGALGYVPSLPQGGIAGSNADRVVVLYSSFGRNAPLSPYNLGRTTTHEVGHYLGLYHTFTGGCAGGNCFTRGDRICDTNDESSPTFGCPSSRSTCGEQAPIDNYMNYTDDRCMYRFTSDQVRRMRCTLLNYRPNVFEVEDIGPCSAVDFVEPLGVLNFTDVSAFVAMFGAGNMDADINGDGVLNFVDVSTFVGVFAEGC